MILLRNSITFIKGDNVRQDTTGNVHDLVLGNTGIVDELLPAGHVVKFTSDVSVFIHGLSYGRIYSWLARLLSS